MYLYLCACVGMYMYVYICGCKSACLFVCKSVIDSVWVCMLLCK